MEKDDTIDLKGIFKSKKKDESQETSSNEISLDLRRVGKWFASKKRVWLLLILIPLLLSVWFRAYPAYLPITDDWASDTVNNHYRQQVSNEINQKYPQLPDQRKQEIIETELQRALEQNKQVVDAQRAQVSQQLKQQFQDDKGQTYLLAIDPWLWYGYAKNKVQYGHYGNELRESGSWYTLRNGRVGQAVGFAMMPFLTVINYHFLNIFGDASVMTAQFYLPVILIALASLAAFIIGYRMGGYPAAVVGASIVGIHSVLLRRTTAGFADTDILITFFELWTPAFFILAFSEPKKWRRWTYLTLAGLSMALYARSHQSWWHTFDFMMGALVIHIMYFAWTQRAKLEQGWKAFFSERMKTLLSLLIGFPALTFLIGGIVQQMTGHNFFKAIGSMMYAPIQAPLNFITVKQVAVTTIWPNVLTTVAELNPSSISNVIGQLGGSLLFTLSLVGIVYLLLKKEKGEQKHIFHAALLILWYIGTIYAARSGLRFIALTVPAFAIALGCFVALCYYLISERLQKWFSIHQSISKVLVIIIVGFIIFNPLMQTAHATARQQIPSMNDAWYESLIGIQNDADDAMITSWWDFGHWFVAVAQRRVTFDGGDQGERIHWVGKSLYTRNESQAVGILRMLNCGQQEAPHVLEDAVEGNTVRAIDILEDILPEDRRTADAILQEEGLTNEQRSAVLKLTHCEDLIPQYYITSEDMVGKAGVWGHFGSWNFTRAAWYNAVQNRLDGEQVLMDKFGMNEEQAATVFSEIKGADADRWISGWPGYQGGLSGCSKVTEDMVLCGNGLMVNTTSYDAYLRVNEGVGVPHSLVYFKDGEIVEKRMSSSSASVSAALVPDNEGRLRSILMDKNQAMSMFTRLFFFRGHGLNCFDLLSFRQSATGNQIYVWKVDWACSSKLDVLQEVKKEEPKVEETDEVIEKNNETVKSNKTEGNASV